jgi:hypothetical protein
MPPSSVSGSSGPVVVAPASPSGTKWPAPTSVSACGVGDAQLGAVEQAVVVAVRIERVDEPVAVRVDREVRLSPSITPSSSLSASSGSVPELILEVVGEPSPSLSCWRRRRRDRPSDRSRPRRSRRRGLVLGAVLHAAVVGVRVERAGGRAGVRVGDEVPLLATSVSGSAVVTPSSVPSSRPSSSLSGSSALISPSPSLSVPGSAPAVDHAVVVAVGVVRVGADRASSSSGRPSPSVSFCRSSSRRGPPSGSVSPASILPLWFTSSAPSPTPPSSVSLSSGSVVVSPPSASGMKCPFDASVAAFGAVEPELGAVEQAVVVAVRIERVDEPVAVRVLVEVGLLPVDHAVVVAVRVVRVGADRDLLPVRQAVAVRVDHRSRRRAVAVRRSRSPASILPSWFESSAPSKAPPSSVSGSSGRRLGAPAVARRRCKCRRPRWSPGSSSRARARCRRTGRRCRCPDRAR